MFWLLSLFMHLLKYLFVNIFLTPPPLFFCDFGRVLNTFFSSPFFFCFKTTSELFKLFESRGNSWNEIPEKRTSRRKKIMRDSSSTVYREEIDSFSTCLNPYKCLSASDYKIKVSLPRLLPTHLLLRILWIARNDSDAILLNEKSFRTEKLPWDTWEVVCELSLPFSFCRVSMSSIWYRQEQFVFITRVIDCASLDFIHQRYSRL